MKTVKTDPDLFDDLIREDEKQKATYEGVPLLLKVRGAIAANLVAGIALGSLRSNSLDRT